LNSPEHVTVDYPDNTFAIVQDIVNKYK
jgi:hypothetical protein